MKNSLVRSEHLASAVDTTSIMELKNFIKIHEKRKFPAIGLITGRAGYGKSLGVSYVAKNEFPDPGVGGLSTLFVVVPTATTNLAIAQTMTTALNDHLANSRRSANMLSEEIVRKLIEYSVQRIFFDEANRLNAGTFDFVRMIFEALVREDAKISFFLIGLPSIWEVIKKQEQFASRTIRFEFSPLQEEEVLQHFLPNLNIEGWDFDPKDSYYLEHASRLWRGTSPSLRRLVQGVETIGGVNVETCNQLSFSELVDIALRDSKSLEIEDPTNSGQEHNEQGGDMGPHEETSEIRNENRNR